MFTKTTIVSLLMILVLGLSGLGYSQFTSSSAANVTASAGTFTLQWDSSSGALGGSNPSDCALTGGVLTQTISISATNLPAGGDCSVTVYVDDIGSLPGTVTPTLTFSPSGYVQQSSNTNPNAFDIEVSGGCISTSDGTSSPLVGCTSAINPVPTAGYYVQYIIDVAIPVGASNSFQGSTASFTVTVQGTANT